MSIQVNRWLDSAEEVDHIDGNRLNDKIDNLQILTRKDNKDKYAKTCKRTMVSLICYQCGRSFERERRQTYLVRGGSPNTYCSKTCLTNHLKKPPIDP